MFRRLCSSESTFSFRILPWGTSLVCEEGFVALESIGDDVPSSLSRRPPFRARMGSSPNCTLEPSNSFEHTPCASLNVVFLFVLSQIHIEDLQTELEYFSEDYDEEREMEPRLEQTREVTLPLRTRSPNVCRQCERVVGFEKASNREGSRTRRNTEGNKPSEAGAEENGRQ
ncbi:hypothetical protein Tco_1057117 [Tanacetum coccineum]|uniref:Uncharacterized protein n=1 Tax=Tanacetum coccineum TaxID=301880 RepID=A0ABQ5H4G3_9ASTR